MDPNLLTIILGLVVNGLTSLIAISGHKAGELLIGEELLKKWEEEKTALQPVLQKVLTSVAENVEWRGPAREEIVSLFLLSPEVEEIVRQIYATKLVADSSQDTFPAIREVFLTSFVQFVALYPSDIELQAHQLAESVDLLMNALLKECDFVLEHAIDIGILAAHEAKSAFRHHVLQSEIAAIQKKLNFLTSQRSISIQDILEFEKKYRQQVAQRHGYIIPPNFDSTRKIPIDTLYVPPTFVINGETIDMEMIYSRIHRGILLGNPGGGKSTFASKLCSDLATSYSERLFAGRKQVTPILVILRDYGADKKERHCSILEFIEAEATANYQLPKPPIGTFEYILLNGRAVVIFDGLDELLDTSYRQEISSDVESFCNLYPSVPVLVTSREVGYEQAPLDENHFEIFRIASFDDDQVEIYVTKWFEIETDLSLNQREHKVENFLKESRDIPDLRRSPLMLSLMCNIYRGENYIPRNRPDVYEKCATMLFERWDKNRGIRVQLPFEALVNPTMKYLAYWIYASGRLRGGITERMLVRKTTDYLCQKRFEDRDMAEQAAFAFIEFCRGRAWVFTDVGTTQAGERLYQFTHRTFLEYFAAAYLVRTHSTPSMLMSVLQPKIAKREWDVVAQLAFQIQNKNLEDAGDELLLILLQQFSQSEDEDNERLNLLSFAARCLEFIIPAPQVTRRITEACIEYTLMWGLRRKEGR